MDNLDRLRKVLDFEGSLRHDPADRFEGYYPTVVRRLSGRDLILDDALPSASMVREAPRTVLVEPLAEPEPIVPIDIEPAAIPVVDAPLEAPPPAKKGRGRKSKVAEATPPATIIVAPEPEPIAPVEPIEASNRVGFEDEVEFVPFTQEGLPRPVEPGLIEFEELWVEHGPGSEIDPTLMPPTSDAPVGDLAGAEALPVPEGEAVPGAPVEETVVAEAELVAAEDPLTIEGYTLYAKRAHLRGGERTIHFFAREPAQGAVPAALPDGFEVERNPRSRLPYLRRIPAPTTSAVNAARAAKAGRASKNRRKTVRRSKRRSKRNS